MKFQDRTILRLSDKSNSISIITKFGEQVNIVKSQVPREFEKLVKLLVIYHIFITNLNRYVSAAYEFFEEVFTDTKTKFLKLQ